MWKMHLLVVFIISMMNYLQLIEGNDKLQLIIDELEKVQENKDVVSVDLNFVNEKDKIIVSGEVKQLIDINNDYQVSLKVIYSETENDPDPMVLDLPNMGVCDNMEDLYKALFYNSIKDYSNAPDPDECPVPKNTYVIKDYPYDMEFLSNFLSLGYYRLESVMSLNNVTVTHYILRAHVINAE